MAARTQFRVTFETWTHESLEARANNREHVNALARARYNAKKGTP